MNDYSVLDNDRDAAIAWARETLERNNAVILDTETTGLDSGEIVQISVIDLQGKTLLDTLVKPVNLIPRDAAAIHGISNDMVRNAPGWQHVAGVLLPIVTGKTVIIYNADYDYRMLHQSADACGMPRINWREHARFECAMSFYAQFYGEWNEYHGSYRWQRLTNACAQLGIDQDAIPSPAHSALGDCLRTLDVIRAMAKTKAAQS